MSNLNNSLIYRVELASVAFCHHCVTSAAAFAPAVCVSLHSRNLLLPVTCNFPNALVYKCSAGMAPRTHAGIPPTLPVRPPPINAKQTCPLVNGRCYAHDKWAVGGSGGGVEE